MFQIGDYVSFVHHTHGILYGTIKDMDQEDDGYYNDDDDYVEGDVWLTYYIEYEVPIPDPYGDHQAGWWCNEEDIVPVKKERVPSGFAIFIKGVESERSSDDDNEVV